LFLLAHVYKARIAELGINQKIESETGNAQKQKDFIKHEGKIFSLLVLIIVSGENYNSCIKLYFAELYDE
jgi:hypothetical protein